MKHREPTVEDRLGIRERPPGTAVFHQSWDKLLFMHWEISVDALRAQIPDRLQIDTYEGKAYIAITPLTIWGARPAYTPPLPLVSRTHELNVRTYVYLEGVPGVWFFSLDANNPLAVIAARTFFSLPYYTASQSLDEEENRVCFESSRMSEEAKFRAVWTIGDDLPQAEPGTLDFFLIERYCLYTTDDKKKLYRCRILHQPWRLQETKELSEFESSMIEANGLPTPEGEPLLHCGGPVDVDVWALEEV
jgi:uncharacterized protein YqjF (DUF2071 family)